MNTLHLRRSQDDGEYTNAGLNTAQQVPDEAEALSFSDNAPSWPELSDLVARRSAELQWSLPDVESVLTMLTTICPLTITTCVGLECCPAVCRGACLHHVCGFWSAPVLCQHGERAVQCIAAGPVEPAVAAEDVRHRWRAAVEAVP